MRQRRSNFGGSYWPTVISRPDYPDYFSALEPPMIVRGNTKFGRSHVAVNPGGLQLGHLYLPSPIVSLCGGLQPSDLALILHVSAVAAVHVRERCGPFQVAPPRLSGQFPPEPINPGMPELAIFLEPTWEQFAPEEPKFGFLSGLIDLFSGRKAARDRHNLEARRQFERARSEWERNQAALAVDEERFRERLRQYERDSATYWSTRKELEKDLSNELKRYEDHKRIYNDKRNDDLIKLNSLLKNGASGTRAGVEELSRQVLRSIPIPVRISDDFEIRFDPDDKILLFTILLPNLEDENLGVELKTKRRDATEKEIRSSQEFLLHALALRLIHESFATPELGSVKMVGVNMRLNYSDRRNGRRMDVIIGSLAATREEFAGINIAEVDPKLCFRTLKGVSTPSFQNISPVRPLLTFNRNDKRIAENREVVDKLDAETNLAAMDWEDFEHVVRELFSMMFTARSDAAEVLVTRASRDYGVDALIHDPDPIHGGKFVVQAKRYVNTVEVSAVRDLFGTVQNEGANRGYLVTTSSFGPEAYAFAKGKPLTLISGPHLLQLLKDHGYSFRIDLLEARQILHGR